MYNYYVEQNPGHAGIRAFKLRAKVAENEQISVVKGVYLLQPK